MMKTLTPNTLLQNSKYRVVKFEYDDGLCAKVYSAMMAVEIKGRLGIIRTQSPIFLYEWNSVSGDEEAFHRFHNDNALDLFRENGTCYYAKTANTVPSNNHIEGQAATSEDYGNYYELDSSQPWNTWKKIPVKNPLPYPDKEIAISWANKRFDSEFSRTDTKTIIICLDGQSYSSASYNQCVSWRLHQEDRLLYECKWWNNSLDGVYPALKEHGFLSRQHWEIESRTSINEGVKLSFDFIYKSGLTFRRIVNPAMLGQHDLLLIAIREFVIESGVSMYLPPDYLDEYVFYKRPEET